jgi:predicted nucleotidyltransferase
MVFTEIKMRNKKKYYYRVLSVRKEGKVTKKRKYLGVNLSKKEVQEKAAEADKKLNLQKNKETKDLKKIKTKIIKILKQDNIKKAGIFGSYAEGKQKKNSDIDILIQPTKDMSLLDLSGLKIKLRTALGKKVDLVSYNYIHPYLKRKILESEVKII